MKYFIITSTDYELDDGFRHIEGLVTSEEKAKEIVDKNNKDIEQKSKIIEGLREFDRNYSDNNIPIYEEYLKPNYKNAKDVIEDPEYLKREEENINIMERNNKLYEEFNEKRIKELLKFATLKGYQEYVNEGGRIDYVSTINYSYEEVYLMS